MICTVGVVRDKLNERSAVTPPVRGVDGSAGIARLRDGDRCVRVSPPARASPPTPEAEGLVGVPDALDDSVAFAAAEDNCIVDGLSSVERLFEGEAMRPSALQASGYLLLGGVMCWVGETYLDPN